MNNNMSLSEKIPTKHLHLSTPSINIQVPLSLSLSSFQYPQPKSFLSNLRVFVSPKTSFDGSLSFCVSNKNILLNIINEVFFSFAYP